MSEKISAAAFILIGGSSRRFGKAKWRATLNGKTLLARAWDLCYSHFDMTYLVSKEIQRNIDKPIILDLLDIQTPFSGVYSALVKSTHLWNFVMSCDLPLINVDIINELWANVSPDLDVVIPGTNRGLEPTCSFYSRKVIEQCRKMIEKGDYALHHLAGAVKTKVINFAGKENLFVNVNTPEELNKAMCYLRKV